MAEKSLPITGGCLCGAIRYECHEDPIYTYHCHCRDCQRTSGAGFITCIEMNEPAFSITAGEPASYEVETEAGNRLTRYFCSNCGSQLFSTGTGFPTRIIKAGSLDDPSSITPIVHIWTASQQPWIKLCDGVPTREREEDLPNA